MNRALALCALTVLSACTRAAREDDSSRDVLPDCHGQLLMAVPELPYDLQRAPSGDLLVVDRGGLLLRSERDFHVTRHLAEGIDGWYRGGFVADAGVWRGETFDGQRYDVDPATGRATRLYDARVSRDERELRERNYARDLEDAFTEAKRAATQLVQSTLEARRVPVEVVPELEATAALLDGDTLILSDVTNTLWKLDVKAHAVSQKALCAMCSPKVALLKTRSGVVAIDRAGVVTRLNDALEAEHDAPLRPDRPGNDDAIVVTHALLGAGGDTLAWLASDGQHGLFDLVTFTPLAHERALGFHGVTGVSFAREDELAFVAAGAVEVRSVTTGAVLRRKAGNFVAAAGLPGGELLGIRGDGVAQSLTGTSPPRCVSAAPCPLPGKEAERAAAIGKLQTLLSSPGLDEVGREALQRQLDGQLASRRYLHALSPDGRHVAFVGWPENAQLPGTLTVFAVGDWSLVKSAEVSAQYAGEAPFWQGGAVTVSSVRFDVPGAAAAAPSLELERKASHDGGYDWVVIARGKDAVVVSDEVAGTTRRAELHRGAHYAVGASSRVWAIGGSSVAPLPSGRLNVYCAPDALAPKVPAAVPVPRVAEIEGVLEVALDDLPPRYESLAAEPDGAAWVLGVAANETRVLARILPDGVTAEVHKLPSEAPFSRLLLAGDSLWALSGRELAKRSKEGVWTTMPLGSEGDFKQAVALPNGEVAGVLEAAGQRELIVTGATLFRRPVIFTRELPPLVALPDGVLVPPDPRCTGSACERGFVVRSGKVELKDPLLPVVAQRKPLNAWLRGGKIILLGAKWTAIDAATGKVLEELSPQAVFRKRKHPVGPRPAPTPYLDSLEVELIRFVDREGAPLALAALRGPAWIPEIAQAYDAVDTQRGSWARKGTLSVMFWDGANLRAYFHPETREKRLREMQ